MLIIQGEYTGTLGTLHQCYSLHLRVLLIMLLFSVCLQPELVYSNLLVDQSIMPCLGKYMLVLLSFSHCVLHKHL